MKKNLIISFVLICAFVFAISCNNKNVTGAGGGNTGGSGGGSTVGSGYVLPAGSLSQEEQNQPMDPNNNYTTLWTAGQGATGYRIPALAVTRNGVIVAAADRRHNGYQDLGKQNVIDVVVRTSKDLGKTWSESKVVVQANNITDSYGDAFLMVDPVAKSTIYMGVVTEPGIQKKDINQTGITKIFRSTDDGATWSLWSTLDANSVIFKGGKAKPSTGFGASGQGVTLRYGQHKGKIMFAFFGWGANSSGSSPLTVSAIVSSDGKTWENLGYLNSSTGGGDGNIDETKAIELSDGRILFNHRRSVSAGGRSWSISSDGGASWQWLGKDPELVDPGNNADIFRYEYNGKRIKTDKYILYIHSDQAPNGTWYQNRINHHVKLSVNELNNGAANTSGKFQYDRQLINDGMNTYSGYPTITVLPDGTIATLTEELPKSQSKGTDHYNIVFRRFNLNWLTSGAESVNYSTDYLFQEAMN
ncbi:sialidase family protein [Brachyspira murdochii]|uniref:exo-alpha-sialidase n=1 Tax=Brachyspira murdochii (strain ATCC 51284 / DSM 12563 / 56-150) TaxID=526224 RepID=D5UBC0_BRAM5|nr:sialidase family protein [Brachyspira murdochii]ADG71993.1 glycosyl hydrolase BNR repeat-containing protein [Brachyspira murdochii DSM 12563]